MAVRCAAIWLAALAVIDFALASKALDEYDGDFGDLMDLDGLADSGGGLDGFGDLGHLGDYDHNEDGASCGHVPGWASLDDITFDKIVQGDTRAAVLFWDKTSSLEYESLHVAAELGLHENLLLIRVNKDDSPMLVARYKLKTIPRLMFLPGGGQQPLEFFGELTEADEQVAWLEAKAGRPQELPGLVELVAKLAAADGESSRREAAQAVEEAAALLTGYAARTGELYAKVARKVAKQGLTYLQAEYDRVDRLLTEEALAPAKVEQFKRKLSVLKVYARQGGITIKEGSAGDAKGDVAADREEL